MDIHNLTDLIANQGFPIALSILLIFRIDRFMQEIVLAQKDGYRQILENTKEIHNTITTLNQQNREYYSLRFSEVQKELSGIKVELSRPVKFSYLHRVHPVKAKKGTGYFFDLKSYLSPFLPFLSVFL